PTYYEVLNVSPSTVSSLDPAAATQLIKRAYRRALLNHHPDKKGPKRNNSPSTTVSSFASSSSSYTIDQISTAYATLSQPAQRQAYDFSLTQTSSQSTTGGPEPGFRTGIETIDLDDLEHEEYHDNDGTEASSTTARWYRSCRCGNPRGYHFTEADLEDAADLGELMVGCADCSLWLRVHFAVIED
ncbi:DnaJ-domain-containing protein, partial [Parathielavia appendiculata]